MKMSRYGLKCPKYYQYFLPKWRPWILILNVILLNSNCWINKFTWAKSLVYSYIHSSTLKVRLEIWKVELHFFHEFHSCKNMHHKISSKLNSLKIWTDKFFLRFFSWVYNSLKIFSMPVAVHTIGWLVELKWFNIILTRPRKLWNNEKHEIWVKFYTLILVFFLPY